MKFAGIKAEVLALWGVFTGIVASAMECSASSPISDWCASIAVGFAVAAAVYILFLNESKGDSMKISGIKVEVLALWGVFTGIVASAMECSASSPMSDWCVSIGVGFAVAAAVYILFLHELRGDKSHIAGIKVEVLALWGVFTGIVASIMECSASSPMSDWLASIGVGFSIAAAVYILFLNNMKNDDDADIV